MRTINRFLTWPALALLLLATASGCATRSPPAASLTSASPPLNAQSSVPLPPEPSAQRQRVETLLRKLDLELAALLNLLPAPATRPGEPTR